MYSISFGDRIKNGEQDVYSQIVSELINKPDRIGTTRTGKTVYEKFDVALTLLSDEDCYFDVRMPSFDYMKNEMQWYLSGSLDLEEAKKCSKFWEHCSDDGKTVNSNYGYLLFHKKNKYGASQFAHALQTLRTNIQTKKAVMVLYEPDHAYISKDNPCTMYVAFHTMQRGPEHTDLQLDMSVYMRSSDVWFGLPYDVPFFRAVQHAMVSALKRDYKGITIGYYVHHASNIHIYEDKIAPYAGNVHTYRGWVEDCIEKRHHATNMSKFRPILYTMAQGILELIKEADPQFISDRDRFMIAQAWELANKSKCLKKKCGAVIATKYGLVVGSGFGGKFGSECTKCMRDAGEKFYSDGCWSVHAEMRATFDFLNYVNSIKSSHNFVTFTEKVRYYAAQCIVYTTHGPCDACLKLLDFYGFKYIKYDIPYKTDYEGHWPALNVERVPYTENGDALGKYAPKNNGDAK